MIVRTRRRMRTKPRDGEGFSAPCALWASIDEGGGNRARAICHFCRRRREGAPAALGDYYRRAAFWASLLAVGASAECVGRLVPLPA